jgi:hypothetical protein
VVVRLRDGRLELAMPGAGVRGEKGEVTESCATDQEEHLTQEESCSASMEVLGEV